MWLYVTDGTSPEWPVEVSEGPVVIGRDTSCDLALQDSNISRNHAEVRLVGDRVLEIRDLGSTNGTTVNGRLVDGSTALRPGDVVGIGNFTITVRDRQLADLNVTVHVPPVQRQAQADTPAVAAPEPPPGAPSGRGSTGAGVVLRTVWAIVALAVLAMAAWSLIQGG
jgi:predicted component of type VI protein secretion system